MQRRADVKELCRWENLSANNFHYWAHSGEQGMRANRYTSKGDQGIKNQQVAKEIWEILAQD